LARSVDGNDRMTMTGTSWGTPVYMSPEQIRGIGDIDIRADIYALGATLFTLLTGAEPFFGPTSFVITHQVLSEPAPDPRTLNKTISAEVATVIAKALAKDRDKRYLTVTSFLEDLERARSGQRLLHAAVIPLVRPDPVPAPAVAGQRGSAGARATPGLGVDPLFVKLIALAAVIALLYGVWYSMQGGIRPSAANGAATPWPAVTGTDGLGTWRDLGLGHLQVRFRWCPPGTYRMGSPESESGRSPLETQHPVTLSAGFWMMATECPQALYREVTGNDPSSHVGDDLPVERVSWYDARAFCAALNARVPHLAARLPSEAEWEYASRAGSGSGPFDAGAIEQSAWTARGPLAEAWRSDPPEARESEARHLLAKDPQLGSTHPVAALAANPWGFFDLHGNVQEWCSDAWDGLAASGEQARTDPIGTLGRLSVCRGGSWLMPVQSARNAARSGLRPDDKRDDLGFRIVIPADP
jgi:formylglycine-generating enzyme required for sulfatase activity